MDMSLLLEEEVDIDVIEPVRVTEEGVPIFPEDRLQDDPSNNKINLEQ